MPADPSTGPGHLAVPRRAVLAGIGLGAAGMLAGCASDPGRSVRVGVVWSGRELAEFRRAVRGFTAAEGLGVTVVSLGDDAGPLLAGQVAGGLAPDVAILPQPGLVTGSDRLGDRLEDLRAYPPPKDAPPIWGALASDASGVLRGVWYKTTLKSLVWYLPEVFDEHGLDVPEDWPQWLDLVHRLAAGVPGGGPAPFALGGADGWVLTDWLENVLLGLNPAVFGQLAESTAAWDDPSVSAALTRLADLWSPRDAFPGGIHRSLQTQFEDSVLDVVQRRSAAMLVGADFAHSVARRFARPFPELSWFPVPAPPGGSLPTLVGGDLAVLLKPASSAATRMIHWLASADSARGWAAGGGFVSLDPAVDRYPPEYGKSPVDRVQKIGTLVQRVQNGGGAYEFDLSDRLPAGGLTGGDGRGLWRILQRFLAALGRGDHPDTDAVVGETVRALAEASRGSSR